MHFKSFYPIGKGSRKIIYILWGDEIKLKASLFFYSSNAFNSVYWNAKFKYNKHIGEQKKELKYLRIHSKHTAAGKLKLKRVRGLVFEHQCQPAGEYQNPIKQNPSPSHGCPESKQSFWSPKKAKEAQLQWDTVQLMIQDQSQVPNTVWCIDLGCMWGCLSAKFRQINLDFFW